MQSELRKEFNKYLKRADNTEIAKKIKFTDILAATSETILDILANAVAGTGATQTVRLSHELMNFFDRWERIKQGGEKWIIKQSCCRKTKVSLLV
jgi:hypothetical protein